jgi:hypothetical protein
MYAYFLFVGDFKKFSPEEMVADKREADRITVHLGQECG